MTSNEKDEESMSIMMSCLKTPTGEVDSLYNTSDDSNNDDISSQETRRRRRRIGIHPKGEPDPVRQKTLDASGNHGRRSDYDVSESNAVDGLENVERCVPIDMNGASIFNCLTEVSLEDLRLEYARQDNRKYIDLQLVGIISLVNVAGSNSAYIYGNKNRNRNTGN